MCDNYYGDSRLRAREDGSIFKSVDSRRMKGVIVLPVADDDDWDEESVEVPIKFEVCSVCNGHGSHVNPSIDCNGISGEAFAEDPDFAEDYFSGNYDITCYGCHGARVESVIDESRVNKDLLNRIYDHLRDEARYRAECAAERRMGC